MIISINSGMRQSWWRPTLKALLANPEAAVDNARLRRMPLLDMEEIKNLATKLKSLETSGDRGDELEVTRNRLDALMADVPNHSHSSVPMDNQVMETFSGTATEGTSIHESFGEMIDTEASARTSGSGFYFLKGTAALLELSLINHAFSMAIKHGYTPLIVPDLVKSDLVHKCGFSPRASNHFDPVFRLKEESLVLAGTSELALAGMHQDSIIPRQHLPLKYVALSHCFRRELGKGRGIHRVHQFTKVELFTLSTSDDAHDYLLEDLIPMQKRILQPLLSPQYSFRLLNMAHHELGASAHRKYDIEIAKQGEEGVWKEVTSASDCGEYQARRLGIRWSGHLGGKVSGHVRTFNATALAVPRILTAILDQGIIPSALLSPLMNTPLINNTQSLLSKKE